MKKLCFFTLLLLLPGAGGCKENLPPPNPEKEALLQKTARCPQCRKSSKIGQYERINQILGRCPFCKKIVNVMQAAFPGTGRK